MKKFFAALFVSIVFSSNAFAVTRQVTTTAKVPEVINIINAQININNGITLLPLYEANVDKEIFFTIRANAEGTFSIRILLTDEKGNILEVINGPQNASLQQIAEWSPPKISNGLISLKIEAILSAGNKSPVLSYSFKEKDVL